MTMKHDLSISVSDTAFMHLLMIGMEAYKLRPWGKGTRDEYTETGGVLWGYARNDVNYDHVRIEHISVDLHAERSKNEITLNKKSNMNKKRIVQARWPHLCLIGDFHTHPYEKYSEAKHDRGWEYSEGDRKSWEEPLCHNVWSDLRASLVLTIAKLERVHDENRIDPDVKSDNVLYWQMGNYRFWLSAYALDKEDNDDGSYQFKVTPRHRRWPEPSVSGRRRGRIYLDVPTVTGSSRWFEYGDID